MKPNLKHIRSLGLMKTKIKNRKVKVFLHNKKVLV